MSSGIVRQGGFIIGPWERPPNFAGGHGSIHDDDTARELGFRGAFVTGRTQILAFVPVLLEAFGQRWFEQGTLSVEFRIGVLDREAIRAVLQEPKAGSTNVQAFLEKEDGQQSALGTASVGVSSEPTWIGAKDVTAYDTGHYEMLDTWVPGLHFPTVDLELTSDQSRRFVDTISPLPWYSASSPWGGPVASPALLVNALTSPCTAYRRDFPVKGVAIDGAFDIRNVAGPVFIGRPYRASASVVGRGQSPRTEYVWYDSHLDDREGNRIVEMRMQLRFAKNSSGLVVGATS